MKPQCPRSAFVKLLSNGLGLSFVAQAPGAGLSMQIGEDEKAMGVRLAFFIAQIPHTAP